MIFCFRLFCTIDFYSLQDLAQSQNENFFLRKQVKELKLQLASQAVETKSSARRRKSKSTSLSDDITADDDEISMYARKYSLTISPWPDSAAFDNLCGRPNVDPYCEDRYKTKASMVAANVAELYDFIPARLHKFMEGHSRFSALVCSKNADENRLFMTFISSKTKARACDLTRFSMFARRLGFFWQGPGAL